MITPAEFQERWEGDDDSAPFLVRYPSEIVAAYGLSTADRRIISEAGLPSWAAPHMHFFYKGGPGLSAPSDAYGRTVLEAPPSLGMIGSTAESWPICLDASRPGKVMYLRLEPAMSVQLLNSSISQLVACLLAYRDTVEAALAFGSKHGHKDAWRQGNYPPELDDKLKSQMKSLDPRALSGHGYWLWHFRDRQD